MAQLPRDCALPSTLKTSSRMRCRLKSTRCTTTLLWSKVLKRWSPNLSYKRYGAAMLAPLEAPGLGTVTATSSTSEQEECLSECQAEKEESLTDSKALFKAAYEHHLLEKDVDTGRNALVPSALPELEVFPSPASGQYRGHTEFGVSHKGTEAHHVKIEVCLNQNEVEKEQQSTGIEALSKAHYDNQLLDKVSTVRNALVPFALPKLEVYPSPAPWQYRMRAEFRIHHKGNDAYYVMFEKTATGGKRAKRMDSFPVGSKLMNDLMPALRTALLQNDVVRHKLYQVNFLTTLSGQALITLIYLKPLQPEWRAVAEAMQQALRAQFGDKHVVNIVGRSRKQDTILDSIFVTERLLVNGVDYSYRQMDGAFSQPNAAVCQHMLSWAQDVTSHAHSRTIDLLELYCGNCNFTIPLAHNFRRVVATESSRLSVAAGNHNLAANNVENVLLARMSSEEFTQAWKARAKKFRLKGLDWNELDLQTILVDPPRAGLDEQTLHLVAEFQNIVYISCNPQTLAQNLHTLAKTHKIARFAIFDQFPFTPHIECGAYLVRQS